MLTCNQCVKGSVLDIEYLQESMNHMYRKLYGNKENPDDDTEIVLASNERSKIICDQCKKEGHKSYQCTDK